MSIGLPAVLSLVGTGISAIGTLQAANAQAAASTYNAKVAERDAIVAEQNRAATIKQSQVDAEDKRRENRRVLASMRAQYGSAGIELAGSPLDVLYDTAAEQELDAQRIEYEGQVRGREQSMQAQGLRENAALSRMEASSASSAGAIGMIGTLAGGAGATLQRMG